MSNDEHMKEKILQLIRDTIEKDKELREKFQIGDKFRFIRDRLTALLSHSEVSLASEVKTTQEIQIEKITEEECVVYVYLFNAQGLVLQSWQKMLNTDVFYEHSVNRPIYKEQSQVESFIRGKSNTTQNAYLSIVIKKTDIVQTSKESKDAIGNPLIKVREGSLHFNKLISFTHNGHEYGVNGTGSLVKKN